MRTQFAASTSPAQTKPARATDATSHGRASSTWHRIGAVIREMNYATRRLVELNATVL